MREAPALNWPGRVSGFLFDVQTLRRPSGAGLLYLVRGFHRSIAFIAAASISDGGALGSCQP
jgi:hypothetical protein